LRSKPNTVAFRVSKEVYDELKTLAYVFGYGSRSELLREIMDKAIRQFKEEVLIEQNSGELSQLLGMEKESRKLFLEG